MRFVLTSGITQLKKLWEYQKYSVLCHLELCIFWWLYYLIEWCSFSPGGGSGPSHVMCTLSWAVSPHTSVNVKATLCSPRPTSAAVSVRGRVQLSCSSPPSMEHVMEAMLFVLKHFTTAYPVTPFEVQKTPRDGIEEQAEGKRRKWKVQWLRSWLISVVVCTHDVIWVMGACG